MIIFLTVVESLDITEGDIKFMQGMIFHHAQAIEMSATMEGIAERR